MKSSITSILAIILGLIIVVFPIIGLIAIDVVIGMAVLILAIFLMLNGMAEIDFAPKRSILNLILGILMFVLSLFILFNPEVLSFLISINMYLAGIFLMIAGLIALIENRNNKYGFWGGIAGIILGMVYIVFGTLLANPIILGSLIGIWLIILGIFKLSDR
ncbi:MAG: DUF308 domain-containing protein [Methanobrevibacter sp.]|jgi:uncharacterized membrane protein HdeD (DUF308 family)|nr:DUF308 domain-containing protein [Methanobrevibacter sp.]